MRDHPICKCGRIYNPNAQEFVGMDGDNHDKRITSEASFDERVRCAALVLGYNAHDQSGLLTAIAKEILRGER